MKRLNSAIMVVVVGFLAVMLAGCREEKAADIRKTVEVTRDTIRIEITAAGNVQPQNRLELKPPINGRLEELPVREGDRVKKGQIVAWLSSSERAALLDAARTLGDAENAYWAEVYKPTPLIAPIDGEVIVRPVEPGQQVGSGSAVLVLSDRLIVKARFDETDIGQVRTGAQARIVLDAYPEGVTSGRVDNISFESTVVNNVTVYEVEVLPDQVPDTFRSGMSAEVTVLVEEHADVLVIPEEAVVRENEVARVRLADERGGAGEWADVELGITDGQQIEVVKGLNEGQKLLIERETFDAASIKAPKDSPFMPRRPQRGGGGGGGRPH